MPEKRQRNKNLLVKTIEKELGAPGAFRNPDGGDTHGKKKLETVRKEAEKRAKK